MILFVRLTAGSKKLFHHHIFSSPKNLIYQLKRFLGEEFQYFTASINFI